MCLDFCANVPRNACTSSVVQTVLFSTMRPLQNPYCTASLLVVPSASISMLYLFLGMRANLNKLPLFSCSTFLSLLLSPNHIKNEDGGRLPYPNRLNEREGEKSFDPMVEIRQDEWWRLNHLTHPLSLSSKGHLLIYIS
jgi:hypothetical protein